MPTNLSENDMLDFVAGRSSPEKEAEIRKEFGDPESFANTWIKKFSDQARDALNIDWKRLLEDADNKK